MSESTDSKETEFKRRAVMKRGALAAGVLVVGAQPALARSNRHDRATGEVVYEQDNGTNARASFNAHSDGHPNGPTGQVEVENFSGVDFKGPVSCYERVNPDAAEFSGEITQGGDGDTRFLIIVLDNATPGHRGPNPDQIRVRTGGSGLRDCTRRNLVPSQEVKEGDLKVQHN